MKTLKRTRCRLDKPRRLFVPDIENDLTRRGFLAGAGSLLLLVPYGCGTGSGTSEETTSGGSRTIRSMFGDATIEGEPRRVVALDTRSADNAAALGVVPLAMPQTGTEDEIFPWTEDTLNGGEPPQLLHVEGMSEIPIERVASLEPDVILAVNSFDLNEDNFRTLSEIAPVVHFAENPLTETWQDAMLRVGRTLGRADRAQSLVSETEMALAAARESNPNFEGKTVDLFNVYPGGIAVINSPSDYSIRFLSALGLRLDPETAQLDGQSGRANISEERIDLLEADLLIGSGTTPEALENLENAPLFENLDAVRDGRYAPLSISAITAIAAPSQPSVSWAIDEILPKLEEAMKGDEDPETETTEGD